MSQKWITLESGEEVRFRLLRKEEAFDFLAFPFDFKGATRECGHTCGLANAAEKRAYTLAPGKATRITFKRSMVHIKTVINKRLWIIAGRLNRAAMLAIRAWDDKGVAIKKPLAVKVTAPVAGTSYHSNSNGKNTGARSVSVERGFYKDPHTGRRMRYTKIDGTPGREVQVR